MDRRAAVGGDVDFGEHAEQEDRFDQDDDRHRARDMRQHDIEAKNGDRAGAVERGGFLLFLVERLQRGHEDQAGERQPLPRHDQDHREHRPLVNQIDRLNPTNFASQAKKPGDPDSSA